MKESTKEKLDILKWTVESRNENQRCAIKLFGLLTTYPNQLRHGKYELLAQSLVGVTFSLWRAAFLADKSGKKEASLNSAIDFLETVIADNAVAYALDKKQREWTFNYYTNNVRFTMINLAQGWPNIVPKWQLANRPPRRRWEYGQKLLANTLANFEVKLRSQPVQRAIRFHFRKSKMASG